MGLESIAVYPFERLQKLFAGVSHPDHIDCTIGEPQHAPPRFVLDAHNEAVAKYAGSYPKTRQIPQLTEAIAGYAQRNLGVSLSEKNILALCGSGEGLFSMPLFAKNRSGKNTVVLQTPSYKPYEGAADLAGMRTEFEALTAEHIHQPLFKPFMRGDVQRDAALMFINYPNNPCGANASRETLEKAISLAQEHDFILASDECYIDIFNTDVYGTGRPLSALTVAKDMDVKDFRNVLVFNSLSKRSSLPGMRSG
ncbi:MAG: aminotransferase class I/II-fold pyridoxal phosphate-dependent enzyme, partial [Nanoarchaeota archaeon]